MLFPQSLFLQGGGVPGAPHPLPLTTPSSRASCALGFWGMGGTVSFWIEKSGFTFSHLVYSHIQEEKIIDAQLLYSTFDHCPQSACFHADVTAASMSVTAGPTSRSGFGLPVKRDSSGCGRRGPVKRGFSLVPDPRTRPCSDFSLSFWRTFGQFREGGILLH